MILFYAELTSDHYADFAIILSSCEDVISAEIPMYLEKIGSAIRETYDVETFCVMDDSEAVAWIKKQPFINKIFDEFLHKHGHRSLNEVSKEYKMFVYL